MWCVNGSIIHCFAVSAKSVSLFRRERLEGLARGRMKPGLVTTVGASSGGLYWQNGLPERST